MGRQRWKPIDQRAIVWWMHEHKAKIEVPFAWPNVTYKMPDGTTETKLIEHVRLAYEKYRKERKSKEKEA